MVYACLPIQRILGTCMPTQICPARLGSAHNYVHFLWTSAQREVYWNQPSQESYLVWASVSKQKRSMTAPEHSVQFNKGRVALSFTHTEGPRGPPLRGTNWSFAGSEGSHISSGTFPTQTWQVSMNLE